MPHIRQKSWKVSDVARVPDKEIEMNKKLILFNEYHYSKFIQDSIASDVEIIRQYVIRDADEIEQLPTDVISDRDENTYLAYAVNNREIKIELVRFLLSCGADESHILDIHKAYMAGYSKNRFQRIMNRRQNQKLDGLILGISHGMVGIVEDAMPGNVCNLCHSSQDIYFNYQTLKKCYEQYFYEIKDIKYAVIDMFDYFYFNFDTILSGAMDRFFESSGFLCEERTPWNKKQSPQQINEILEDIWREGRTYREQQLFAECFPFARERDLGVYKDTPVYDIALTDEDIRKYKSDPKVPDIQAKIFQHTIKFQVDNMAKILMLLKEIQPQVRVFMVLLPKYKEVEDVEKFYNRTWKAFFMNIIHELKKDFAFELLDFKDYESFSAKKENYRDLTHLGIDGAARFTEHLSELLLHQYGLDLLF